MRREETDEERAKSPEIRWVGKCVNCEKIEGLTERGECPKCSKYDPRTWRD